MNLFEFSKGKEAYVVSFSPQLLTIDVFKKIIDRDKSKDKETAKKEISFIYFFADIKSDYMYIVNKDLRTKEIVHDVKLPDTWKPDELIEKCVAFYIERSSTVNSSIYKSACKAAMDISNYLNDTDELLAERDANGKLVTDNAKITGALEKVPKIMANLNAAHTELIKEQKITEGRMKGSKTFNMFEDGIGNADE